MSLSANWPLDGEKNEGQSEVKRERERERKEHVYGFSGKNSELVSFSIGHVVRCRVTTSKYCFGHTPALSKHRWRAATPKIMRSFARSFVPS